MSWNVYQRVRKDTGCSLARIRRLPAMLEDLGVLRASQDIWEIIKGSKAVSLQYGRILMV